MCVALTLSHSISIVIAYKKMLRAYSLKTVFVFITCLPSHKFEVVPWYMHAEVDVCVPLPQDTEQEEISLHDDQDGQG